MSRSTYVYVDKENSITLKNVKEYLTYYQEITSKTGKQLAWNYEDHAFPYTVIEKKEEQGNYLLLKGNLDRYYGLLIGVDEIENIIQITLPNSAKHGDKSKANELAKFLRKKLHGKLKLFNGRMMVK
ncbi:protein of unknown function [Salinibacillus kushneri]|uniref:DUF1885 family protein n=1 Tax=Salinibacillus kushneri TaxID=237682 RepID=A0A1I0HTV1_9BACI|nr:DUF1885 family protein [Salinibacillus kushneri]SET86668.1 protein of unknown function [Salinibacillus kushneri]